CARLRATTVATTPDDPSDVW
nr:immunoglobulin heavy chain junction region [Macaca mulatta]